MTQQRTAPSPPADPAPPQGATRTRDLTVNKVLAGAGAAATSAVLGSYFGAAGTVIGAALGSVASTLAATLYQRSLDRTRDSLVARIRLSGGRSVDVGDAAGEVTVPMRGLPTEDATVRLRVEPDVAARTTGRRWWLWIGATVLVFAMGLLVVTGLEWATSSTLTTGETGTSVGRVLDQGAPGVEATSPAEPSSEPDPTTTPDPEPTIVSPGPPVDQSGTPGAPQSAEPTTTPPAGG